MNRIKDDSNFQESKSQSLKKTLLLEKYTNLMSGNKQKAQKVVECLILLKKRNQQKIWNSDVILKEFQIDSHEMQRCFEKCDENTFPSLEAKPTTYKDKLQQFCIKNNYNYEIIKYALNLYKFYNQDNLEQLIDKAIASYNCKRQEKNAPWVYEIYGTKIEDLLRAINLNPQQILKTMTNRVICVEDAIQHEAFRLSKVEKNNYWIEILYKYAIGKTKIKGNIAEAVNDLTMVSQAIAQDYQLTKNELMILAETLSRYLRMIHLYQVADVGLETDASIQKEKIRKYKFNKNNIEESILFTLKFDNGSLLDSKSLLYQKRKTLTQYITEWNTYTTKDKIEVKEKNDFSLEDIEYIEGKNAEIRNILIKRKTK